VHQPPAVVGPPHSCLLHPNQGTQRCTRGRVTVTVTVTVTTTVTTTVTRTAGVRVTVTVTTYSRSHKQQQGWRGVRGGGQRGGGDGAGAGEVRGAGRRNVRGAGPRRARHLVLQVRAPGIGCTVQYSTVQYSTVQYSTVLYSTVQSSAVTVQYSTVQYSTVQYSTVQYSTVPRPSKMGKGTGEGKGKGKGSVSPRSLTPQVVSLLHIARVTRARRHSVTVSLCHCVPVSLCRCASWVPAVGCGRSAPSGGPTRSPLTSRDSTHRCHGNRVSSLSSTVISWKQCQPPIVLTVMHTTCRPCV